MILKRLSSTIKQRRPFVDGNSDEIEINQRISEIIYVSPQERPQLINLRTSFFEFNTF